MLDAGEIIGIKMYDEGGEILYRPALFLLQMMHQGDSVYKQRFIEAAVFGATLGMGAVVGGGIKSVTLVAKIARWTDRAAAAIYLGTRVIQESRGWIIKKFGQEGKAFVHYSEMLNSAAMIYGVGRVIYEMPKLVYNFGKAYKEWRAAVQMGKVRVNVE